MPYTISVNEQGRNISVKSNAITIIAKKGTDLFTNITGDKSADNSPRVLFEPKGDFIISAKVSTKFNAAYDGGALMVYAYGQQWKNCYLIVLNQVKMNNHHKRALLIRNYHLENM